MASKLGKIVADFTTSLASAMAVGATTASLQSATDDDGNALPAGRYFFALDGDNSQKEHISCTLSGTSLTAISSLSRQGVETSGVLRTHRVGSSVTLTDFAHIKFINDLAGGATTFDAGAPLGYDGTASITTANQLATKAYVDGIAIAGSPNASTTTKGIGEVSVTPVSPSTPIFVGDNDPRVPAQAENDALVGDDTSIAVGTGNKFVTQTGLQNRTETYAISTGSANAYVLTLSPVPIALVAGQEFEFKANFANTGTATLNVNSLGVIAIKKLDGATALISGDIANGQIVKVKYDGTNFQMISPIAQIPVSFKGLFASGSATYDISTASGVQNIAHGLGTSPVMFKVSAMFVTSDTTMSGAQSFNGNSVGFVTSPGGPFGETFNTFTVGTNGSNLATAVITATSTNIVLTWTKSGSPTGTVQIIWEALA